MVTHQIGTVLKQAIKTFSGKSEVFFQNLEILKRLLEKTTAEDVNLDPRFKTDTLWQLPNKAPVTYIEIYEDNDITMGIFILKSGTKLPLHNHPQMHGLIKVLFGKIKVSSFSLNTDKCKAVESTTISKNALLDYLPRVFNAEHSGVSIADSNSEICDLGPEIKNLHEIESVDGPAAFLDILAPPYETIMPNHRVRKCCYYSVLKELAPGTGIYRLREVEQPGWYWTDTFPYTGPELLDSQQLL